MMNFNEQENEEERVLGRLRQPGDTEEKALRPVTFEEYSGQTKVKNNLKIFIDAAKKRGEALDHVLLYGPPGLGKTTLQVSLHPRWALRCISPQVLPSRRQAISQLF